MDKTHHAPNRAFLTKAQLAEELQVCPRTLDNLMARRAIPYIKTGKIVRFSLPRVLQALARLEVKEVE
jgi:hypothetical protein